ncbi:hypothetical protein [Mycobacterium sp. OTB74]|jgi:hypothetical protein|uniref:hypothetical protein n=1 Tax=Mycobacterium sp. OTB74 TaxID=1853452 RepID=UPI002475ECE9|nr:hypothetical protein [Mycobacterium sp. OTB74]MDH6245494.1 hypothetical protein [Mycobacterium sp. OTB74]
MPKHNAIDVLLDQTELAIYRHGRLNPGLVIEGSLRLIDQSRWVLTEWGYTPRMTRCALNAARAALRQLPMT